MDFQIIFSLKSDVMYFVFVLGMMHSFIGFLFDVITCKLQWNKKDEKVSL